jgi:hypothetical protein
VLTGYSSKIKDGIQSMRYFKAWVLMLFVQIFGHCLELIALEIEKK